MTESLVAVPYVPGGLRPEVFHAIAQQYPGINLITLDPDDPYAYADALRWLWRLDADLVIVEQDVIPPPGAIRKLLECTRGWCTHPHQVEGRELTDTLGLARFSLPLRRLWGNAADQALAAPDPRVWTRLGWTNVEADANAATLERRGSRATLRPDAQTPPSGAQMMGWPSTVEWRTCDSQLARVLRGLRLRPHVHQPATTHLHQY